MIKIQGIKGQGAAAVMKRFVKEVFRTKSKEMPLVFDTSSGATFR